MLSHIVPLNRTYSREAFTQEFELSQRFLNACIAGNLEEIKEICALITPSIHDLQYRNTSLNKLCEEGHLDCIKFLCNSYHKTYCVSNNDAFLNACSSSNVDLVSYICQ